MSTRQPSSGNLAVTFLEEPWVSCTLKRKDAHLLSKTLFADLSSLDNSIQVFSVKRKLGSNQNSFAVTVIRKEAEGAVLVIFQPLPSRVIFAAAVFRVDCGDVKGSLEGLKIRSVCFVTSSLAQNLVLNSPVDKFRRTKKTLGTELGYVAIQQQLRPPRANLAVIKPAGDKPRRNIRAQRTTLEFLRFVLSRDEITSTAASIRAILSACLTCAEKHVGELSLIMEQKLDGLEKAIAVNFRVDEQTSTAAIRLRRPSLAKAATGLSQPDISTLPNNMTPCIEPISKATIDVLHLVLSILQETNSISFGNIATSCKHVAGSVLGVVCRRTKATVHSRFTRTGTILLTGLRCVLFTPITNWKGVRWLKWKESWDTSPLDVISYVLAFLINVAAGLVEGGSPARIAAFDYKTSVNSSLRDPTSIAAFSDIKDYMGISISTIKALQIPTDIFAEPEIPVFGWGELILRIVILTLQFPRNRSVPGYNKRVTLFACWASETITYHLLLFLNLGHVIISSRTLAAVQTVISILAFVLLVSMQWIELGAQGKNDDKAKQIIYLNLSSATFGTAAGLAGKAGVMLPNPSSRALCAVVMAVANKGNAIIQTTVKVRRK